MDAGNIKSFSVYGLFGTDDVHIPFDEHIKILIGENGLGKTQILNLFYYTLERNFFRLREFRFDKLVLEFHHHEPIKIRRKDLDNWVKEYYKYPMIKDLIGEIGYSKFEELRKEFLKIKGNWEKEAEAKSYYKSGEYSVVQIHNILEIIKEKQSESPLRECEKRIESGIEGRDIMYLPTYRRVEEDLCNMGYNNDKLLNQEDIPIQFGMDDVQECFNQIEKKIDEYLKKGLSEISSEILSQLIEDNDEISDKDFLKNIDKNDVEILLSRVGDRISEIKKEKIRELLLNTGAETRDRYLNFFLKKLIEIYSSQKELDKSVKVFRDVCNKYLIDKEVFYDESEIRIFIKSKRNSSEIELNTLSSGEKQIISIFSNIYLSGSEKRFIVLFDEPELSLSMTWQKQLLPDIINSGKCEFLLAATHSPFIFDNELDNYAVGLNEYVKPSKSVTV